MQKFAFILTLLFTCHVMASAQNLTKAEVDELMNQAIEWNKEGKYKEALDGFLKVGMNTAGQRTEEERQTYVCSRLMAIMCYGSLGQYEEGFELTERTLKGILTEEEKSDFLSLYVMNGYFTVLSYLDSESQRYEDARKIINQILPHADKDMRVRILPKIPLSWYFEGAGFQMRQQYDQAMICMKKACKGFHEVGEINNEVDALCQLAVVKGHLYDTIGSLNTYQEAKQLVIELKDDEKLMEILKEQFRLTKMLGDTEFTFTLTVEMDSMAAVTDNPKIRFDYYNYKGDEATKQEAFNSAEQLYRMNESYIEQLKEGNAGADKYLYYNNLRDLYCKMERYDEALSYADKCIKEWQSQFQNKENDWSYYMPYMNKAEIYRLMGDSLNCFRCVDTLFLSLEKLDEPKEIHQLYTVKARCQASFGNYAEALNIYQEADRILAAKYDMEDGDRVQLLALMGGLEYKLEHYDESERLYALYEERTKNLYGEYNTEHIDALVYLANAEGLAGHIKTGCRHYTEAVNMLKEQTQKNLPYFTTAERNSYWRTISNVLQEMTPFALKARETQTMFTEAGYDGLVLSKAFLLETERSMFDIIKTKGTKDDLRDYSSVMSMKAQVKEWQKNERLYADSILHATLRIEGIEKRLSNKCRGYGDMTAFMRIDYRQIKKNLKDEDVVIDFTDFISKSRGRVYAAYIINKKQQYPLLKELFAESSIDSLEIPHPDMFYERPYAKEIFRLLWQPFQGHVKEGATVYYVPSQLFFQVALEAIPMEDGSLLGEHYRFVRLSSAREIVKVSDTIPIDLTGTNPNAVLYGGLQYDIEPKLMAEESSKYDVPSLLVLRDGILRGDSIYQELPETGKEVDAIEKILEAHHLDVKKYVGPYGTEESFISLNNRPPQILHIATHGFYYTPDAAKDINYLQGYTDAMSLSGLILSGGNAEWLNKELPEGVLGGILTAIDITRLNLEGVEMAVLSACQTGQGKATSEGLFGLQRAFKKAGVKTMVMTLWSVSDVVTKEFMIKFYETLADKSFAWDKRKAFEQAKSYIRAKYSEPFYWAGFVMLD